MRSPILPILVLSCLAAAAPQALAGNVRPDYLLVGDRFGLNLVEPGTRNRDLVSSFVHGQGPDFGRITAIAVERSGQILVVDGNYARLFRVDPATGDRTILSGSGAGAGPPFEGPGDVALEDDGGILVSDSGIRIVRVSALTGDRTILSGCDQPCTATLGNGPAFGVIRRLLVEEDGSVLALCSGIHTFYPWVVRVDALYRVDPITGNRTILSGCTDTGCGTIVGTGPPFTFAPAMAFENDGGLIVDDVGRKALLRIDRRNGNRTIFSGCADDTCAIVVGEGLPPDGATDVTVDHRGRIFLPDALNDRVVLVDPKSGDRSNFSGGEYPTIGSGASFETPDTIEAVPYPPPRVWMITGTGQSRFGSRASTFSVSGRLVLNADRTYLLEDDAGGSPERGVWFQDRKRIRLYPQNMLDQILDLEDSLAMTFGEQDEVMSSSGSGTVSFDSGTGLLLLLSNSRIGVFFTKSNVTIPISVSIRATGTPSN